MWAGVECLMAAPLRLCQPLRARTEARSPSTSRIRISTATGRSSTARFASLRTTAWPSTRTRRKSTSRQANAIAEVVPPSWGAPTSRLALRPVPLSSNSTIRCSRTAVCCRETTSTSSHAAPERLPLGLVDSRTTTSRIPRAPRTRVAYARSTGSPRPSCAPPGCQAVTTSIRSIGPNSKRRDASSTWALRAKKLKAKALTLPTALLPTVMGQATMGQATMGQATMGQRRWVLAPTVDWQT